MIGAVNWLKQEIITVLAGLLTGLVVLLIAKSHPRVRYAMLPLVLALSLLGCRPETKKEPPIEVINSENSVADTSSPLSSSPWAEFKTFWQSLDAIEPQSTNTLSPLYSIPDIYQYTGVISPEQAAILSSRLKELNDTALTKLVNTGYLLPSEKDLIYKLCWERIENMRGYQHLMTMHMMVRQSIFPDSHTLDKMELRIDTVTRLYQENKIATPEWQQTVEQIWSDVTTLVCTQFLEEQFEFYYSFRLPGPESTNSVSPDEAYAEVLRRLEKYHQDQLKSFAEYKTSANVQEQHNQGYEKVLRQLEQFKQRMPFLKQLITDLISHPGGTP